MSHSSFIILILFSCVCLFHCNTFLQVHKMFFRYGKFNGARQQWYRTVKANEPEALVSIIKMIYQRNQKRLAQGKNVPQRMQDIFRQQRIYYIWNWEWHLENQSRKYVKQLSSILTRANCEIERKYTGRIKRSYSKKC